MQAGDPAGRCLLDLPILPPHATAPVRPIRRPQLHRPPGAWRHRYHRRGRSARQPLAADFQPGCFARRRAEIGPASRGGSNGAVFIRPLKAVTAEHCLANGGYPRPDLAPDTASGSASLALDHPASALPTACAPTVTKDQDFEELRKGRRELRYGISSLPPAADLLEQEIEPDAGAGDQLSTPAHQFAAPRSFPKNSDALCRWSWHPALHDHSVRGSPPTLVLGRLDFLHAVRSGEPVPVGPRCVVISSSNVSIDVLLTALRAGARHANLAWLSRRDMPGQPAEIELAVPEGVDFTQAGTGPRIDEDGVLAMRTATNRDQASHFDPVSTKAPADPGADHVILGHRSRRRPVAARRRQSRKQPRLYRCRTKDLDDQRPWRLPRRRRAARPAHSGGGDPLGGDATASIDAWLPGRPRIPRPRSVPHAPMSFHWTSRQMIAPYLRRSTRCQKNGRRDSRRGPLRPDRRRPDRRYGLRRSPALPALRYLHRLRTVHGRTAAK